MATRKQKSDAAIDQLIERGAVNEKKEDRFGDTRSGWWIDDTFLGRDPIDALNVILG